MGIGDAQIDRRHHQPVRGTAGKAQGIYPAERNAPRKPSPDFGPVQSP
jgi:hypothetical protein